MYTKRISGPYPLSCITCRERRKKCDRTHPTCNRCKTGGFTCQGYATRDWTGDDPPKLTPHQSHSPFPPSQSTPLPPDRQYAPIPSFPTAGGVRPPATLPSFSTFHDRPFGAEPFAPVFQRVPAWPPGNPTSVSHLGMETLSTSSAVHPSSSTHLTHSRTTLPQERTNYPQANTDSSERERPNRFKHGVEDADIYRVREAAPQSKIYPDLDSSVIVVEFISSQYERAYRMMAFSLASNEENFVQNSALAGIKLSKSSCWSLFLGAKVFEALMLNHSYTHVKPYLKFLDRFAEQIGSVRFKNITMRELAGLLSAALEFSYLKSGSSRTIGQPTKLSVRLL